METGEWAGPTWQQPAWPGSSFAPWPPPPPGKPPIRWLPVVLGAVGGVGIGIVLGLLVFVVMGVSGAFDTEPLTRGPGGALPRFDLVDGQCANGIVEPGASFDPDAAVPCDEPHELEVYASLKPPGALASHYPDPGDLDVWADTACLLALESFVGQDYDESDLDYVPVVAGRTTWQHGDLDTRCVLMQVDGEVLDRSARESGR